MKTCRVCGVEITEENTYVRIRYDSKGEEKIIHRTICKSCHIKESLNRRKTYNKNKAAKRYIDFLKESGKPEKARYLEFKSDNWYKEATDTVPMTKQEKDDLQWARTTDLYHAFDLPPLREPIGVMV